MDNKVRLPAEWADWKITDEVGSGSYGAVYRAERQLGDEKVVSAIKIIHVPWNKAEGETLQKQMNLDADQTYSYYRGIVSDCECEIRAMEDLQGITNIVSVQDYAIVKETDRIGWTLYLRMEFLTCFSDYLQEHGIDEDEAIRLGIEICTALEFCAQEHIIHRDIKPENIFVTKHGNFKLGDFGISRKLDQAVSTYTQRGTSSYMAPEVYHSEQYGPSVDQYSLGLVLYRIMNGNRDPFLDPDKRLLNHRERQEAILKRLNGAALAPPSHASREFARIILKACSYEPCRRYENAAQMGAALKELQQKRSQAGSANRELPKEKGILPKKAKKAEESAAPKNSEKPVRRSGYRFRIPAAAAAVLAVVLALSHTGGTHQNSPEEEEMQTGADASEDKAVSETESSSHPLYEVIGDADGNAVYLKSNLFGIILDDSHIILETLSDGSPKSPREIVAGDRYSDDGSVLKFTGTPEKVDSSMQATKAGSPGLVKIAYKLEKENGQVILNAAVADYSPQDFTLVSADEYES